MLVRGEQELDERGMTRQLRIGPAGDTNPTDSRGSAAVTTSSALGLPAAGYDHGAVPGTDGWDFVAPLVAAHSLAGVHPPRSPGHALVRGPPS